MVNEKIITNYFIHGLDLEIARRLRPETLAYATEVIAEELQMKPVDKNNRKCDVSSNSTMATRRSMTLMASRSLLTIRIERNVSSVAKNRLLIFLRYKDLTILIDWLYRVWIFSW